jgi:hypothetical protein
LVSNVVVRKRSWEDSIKELESFWTDIDKECLQIQRTSISSSNYQCILHGKNKQHLVPVYSDVICNIRSNSIIPAV